MKACYIFYAWLGAARQSMAWHGAARLGKARRGKVLV